MPMEMHYLKLFVCFCIIVNVIDATEQWAAVSSLPASIEKANCIAKFNVSNTFIPMETNLPGFVEIFSNTPILQMNHDISFYFESDNKRIAVVDNIITNNNFNAANGTWQSIFNIQAKFMGTTEIHIKMLDKLQNTTTTTTTCRNSLKLNVIRKQRFIDHVFTGSVALVVSLLYIIFGAALDVNVLKSIIRKPVGPAIGFLSQSVIMPLLSYAIGSIVFTNSVEMQLGLFFTGISPSGGASNMWAVLLGGNINLSIIMTAISNFVAFGMVPLWIFTLGGIIFSRGNMHVPYKNIVIFAVSLVIPLAIGIFIQKWKPQFSQKLLRLLKPTCSCLIMFIVIFAIITNAYLFELFSWQIIVAGLLLPWLGYTFAWLLAKLFRQNTADSLTIAIETGIQNTGIAIFLLRFSLAAPQDDLTTVIPVSVAIMTPLPLLAIYIYRRIHNKKSTKEIISSDQNCISSIR